MQGGNYENTYLMRAVAFVLCMLEEEIVSRSLSVLLHSRSEDHEGKSVSLFLVSVLTS